MSKVLVVANETVGADELLAELRQIEQHKASEYLVMVPARPLHEEHGAVWSQEGAQDAARARLDHTLAILHDQGLEAHGTIGDCRPLNAIADALMDFDADQIVISTHPSERSRWLRAGLVESARKRFDVPVVHVVSHVAEPAPT